MDAGEGGGEGSLVRVRDRRTSMSLAVSEGLGLWERTTTSCFRVSRTAERMMAPRPPVAPAIATLTFVKRASRYSDFGLLCRISGVTCLFTSQISDRCSDSKFLPLKSIDAVDDIGLIHRAEAHVLLQK